MKSFSLFLVDLNDGTTHAGLTGDFAQLLQEVQSHGRSGSMTLKIKVSPATKNTRGGDVDKVTITAERKLELPKPDQPSDFFWLTDTGEPTRQHPRQHALDLRDATASKPASAEFTPPDADGVITFKEAKQ